VPAPDSLGTEQDQMLLPVGVEAPQDQVLDHKAVPSAKVPGQCWEEEAD
jgi:hypothetical protein